jgi:hypothetical protein
MKNINNKLIKIISNENINNKLLIGKTNFKTK